MNIRTLTLLASLSFAGFTQAEPASQQSVEDLLVATGAADLGAQMMAQMLPAMKQSMPDAPEAFWTEFQAQADFSVLMQRIIPIYQKHLTEEDVEAINQFYRSEAGQRLVKVQPQIMQESMMAGQTWGQEAAQKAMMKVQSAAQAGQ